jgi:hypothetical protein
MGSHVWEDDWDDPLTPVPPLLIGLTMILKGLKVLADKGFAGTSRMHPNMNEVATPMRPTGRKEQALFLPSPRVSPTENKPSVWMKVFPSRLLDVLQTLQDRPRNLGGL